MSYRQSIEGCLSPKIGDAGLSQERLAHFTDRLAARFERLAHSANEGSFAHFRVLDATDDIDEARAAYARLVEGADTIVILGTGGSSLGGQAIAQLGGWSIPGDNGPNSGKRPRLRFYDNLDERSFICGLGILNFEKTRFIVISKSGGTAETLLQTLTAFAAIEAAGQAALIPKIFLGVTEPARAGVANGLRTLFTARGIPLLDHDTEIGGRFSAFTTVGLMPALARGLDVVAFRRGARDVVSALQASTSIGDFAPAVGAAVVIGLAKDKGLTNSIMMPYTDRLGRFSAWYGQLWAESLGKGGEGTTPIAALGPVDQHSQLQLYMDGPHTHMINVVRVTGEASAGAGTAISEKAATAAGAEYLAGRTIGDLVRAQQLAIVDAFAHARRPVRTFDLDRLDEYTLGALMMHFMIETIFAADILGVDPFDQPAVELGKRLTREYLAR